MKTKETKTMQITLTQPEINEALKQYIETVGISMEGKQIEVEYTAGRGAAGITAQVELTKVADVPAQGVPTSDFKPTAVRRDPLPVLSAAAEREAAAPVAAQGEVPAEAGTATEVAQEGEPAVKAASLFG